MVTDVGGIDDKSFNASAWKGLQNAKAGNDNIEIKYTASKAEADYEVNRHAGAAREELTSVHAMPWRQFVGEPCDLELHALLVRGLG